MSEVLTSAWSECRCSQTSTTPCQSCLKAKAVHTKSIALAAVCDIILASVDPPETTPSHHTGMSSEPPTWIYTSEIVKLKLPGACLLLCDHSATRYALCALSDPERHTIQACPFPVCCTGYSLNTKHLYNIYTMSDQRRRRWADIV